MCCCPCGCVGGGSSSWCMRGRRHAGGGRRRILSWMSSLGGCVVGGSLRRCCSCSKACGYGRRKRGCCFPGLLPNDCCCYCRQRRWSLYFHERRLCDGMLPGFAPGTRGKRRGSRDALRWSHLGRLSRRVRKRQFRGRAFPLASLVPVLKVPSG